MSRGRHRGPRGFYFKPETRFMGSVLGICYGWGFVMTGLIAWYDCSNRDDGFCAAGYNQRILTWTIPALIVAFIGTRGMYRYFRSLPDA